MEKTHKYKQAVTVPVIEMEVMWNGTFTFINGNTMVMEPQPVTFGMTDFPIYCTHDPILEILTIELTGYPRNVCHPPDKMGKAPCCFSIYKDPDNIPEDVFERVGKKKPERM